MKCLDGTIGEQKANNIHLNINISCEEFIDIRTTRDKTPNMPTLILPSIQINIRAGELTDPEENGTCYLKIPLNAI